MTAARRCLLVALTALLVVAGCAGDDEAPLLTPDPTPVLTPTVTPLDIDPEAIKTAVLAQADLPGRWQADAAAQPSTVQIGGKVGAANLADSTASATSAFGEIGGKAYVTNTVHLFPTARHAAVVMSVHRESAQTTHWEQARTDAGRNVFDLSNPRFPQLGDDAFAAQLKVTIEKPSGAPTVQNVEYIVYRIGPVLGFVLGQEYDADPAAQKQAEKVGAVIRGASG